MSHHQDLDFNEQFLHACHLLEHTNKNIFITGKAGTGKSTLLRYFRESTAKNIVVLAPTGVAAVNIQGQTIHSFFHFKPDITPESVKRIKMRKKQRELYQSMGILIIDEISMVRADLLDCVDMFLKLNGPYPGEPFGGVQLVFIGDLYQLPPVVTDQEKEIFNGHYRSPYFFDAHVMEGYKMEFIDLEKIYRQEDNVFIDLLNAIRKNVITRPHLDLLNSRVNPQFVPKETDLYVYLTTTNALSDRINQHHLSQLKSPALTFDGTIEGQFEMKSLPTHEALELRVGAQVMLLNNDQEGRWINGSVGRIVDMIPGFFRFEPF